MKRARHRRAAVKIGEWFVTLWAMCFLAVIFLGPFVTIGLMIKFILQ